ncbi:MAG TPA: hypothetical protein VG225_04660 [Terracidiphilus sp.]|nr:hypothetical protein [Terracidiphilus sp.]
MALVLAVFSVAGRGQDVAASALKHIATTPYFAFGGVGYAGITSQGETDFRVLITQPRAIALQSFEKLYETGNGESKAYALAGIRELNPGEFDQMLSSLLHSTEKISTMEGCIVEQQSLAHVGANLKSGRYDYWIRRQPKR